MQSQVLLSIAVWALRLFLVAVQACCVGIAALLFALVTYVLLYMATVPQVTHSFPLTFQYPHQDGVPALRNSAILPADVAAAYSDQRGLSGGVALIAGALPPAYATDPTDFPSPRHWARPPSAPAPNAKSRHPPLASADAAATGGLALPAEPPMHLPEQPSPEPEASASMSSELRPESETLVALPDGSTARYAERAGPSRHLDGAGALPGGAVTANRGVPSPSDGLGFPEAAAAADAAFVEPADAAAPAAASGGAGTAVAAAEAAGALSLEASSSAAEASTLPVDQQPGSDAGVPTALPRPAHAAGRQRASLVAEPGSVGRADHGEPARARDDAGQRAGDDGAGLPEVDVGSALHAGVSAVSSALAVLWSGARWLVAALWWTGRVLALPVMWVLEAAWWTLTRPAAFLLFALPPLPHGSWALWAASAGGGGVLPAPSPLPAHVVSPFEAAAAASSIAPPGSPVAVSRVRSTRVEPWQATSSMRSTAPRDVDRLLVPNQGYDVVLLLHTPTSLGRERGVDEVFGAGVFMAQLELLGPRAELLARCSSPFQLRRQHWAVSAAEDLLRALLPGARWALPSEGSVRRRCADGFVDPPEAPLTTVRASVSSREARVLTGELRLEAQLEGFAFAMHHWFVASALLGVGYLLAGYSCCFGCCCIGANIAVLAAMDDEEDTTGAGPLLEVLGLRRAWPSQAAAAADRRNREQMPRAWTAQADGGNPPRGWQDRDEPVERSAGRSGPQAPQHADARDGLWEQDCADAADGGGRRVAGASLAGSHASSEHGGTACLPPSGGDAEAGRGDVVVAAGARSRSGSRDSSRSGGRDTTSSGGRSRSRSRSGGGGGWSEGAGRSDQERGRALSTAAAAAAALDAERRVADYMGAARAAAVMAGAVPRAGRPSGLAADAAASDTVRAEPWVVDGAVSEARGTGGGPGAVGGRCSGRGAAQGLPSDGLGRAARDGTSLGTSGAGGDEKVTAAGVWRGGRAGEVASEDGEHDVLGVI